MTESLFDDFAMLESAVPGANGLKTLSDPQIATISLSEGPFSDLEWHKHADFATADWVFLRLQLDLR